MKKNKLFVLSPAIALGGSLLIASCAKETISPVPPTTEGNEPSKDPSNPCEPSNPNTPQEDPSKPNGDEVIDEVNEINNDSLSNLQAVTAMNLLNFNHSSSALTLNAIKTRDRNRPITEAEKQEIIDMLPTLDLLMMEDQAFTSTISEVNEVINNQTYQFKEVIGYKDNTMTNSNITLYFNITNSWTRGENFMQSLEGVALSNNDPTHYSFSSLTHHENDRSEIEEERNFRIQTGANSYILVKQESESEWNETENEFEYTIVENGRRVDNYSISIENEWNRKSVSYEVNETEYEMEIIERNGEKYYVVEYENESGWVEAEALLVFRKVVDSNGNARFEEVYSW